MHVCGVRTSRLCQHQHALTMHFPAQTRPQTGQGRAGAGRTKREAVHSLHGACWRGMAGARRGRRQTRTEAGGGGEGRGRGRGRGRGEFQRRRQRAFAHSAVFARRCMPRAGGALVPAKLRLRGGSRQAQASVYGAPVKACGPARQSRTRTWE